MKRLLTIGILLGMMAVGCTYNNQTSQQPNQPLDGIIQNVSTLTNGINALTNDISAITHIAKRDVDKKWINMNWGEKYIYTSEHFSIKVSHMVFGILFIAIFVTIGAIIVKTIRHKTRIHRSGHR